MRCSTNPAERLNEILIRAKDYAKKDLIVSEMWADVFEIDREDKSEVLTCITNVIMLTENVKKAVVGLRKGNKDSLVKGILKLQNILLRMDLNEDSSSFVNHIDELILNTIEGCSLALDIAFDYKEVEKEQLDTMRAEVNRLINEVLDSSISEQIKNFIVLKLKEIDYAILNYRMSGVEGVKDAISKCAGEIVLENDICKEVTKNNEKLKTILEKVLGAVRNINSIVTFSCGTVPMLSKKVIDAFLR